jgi:hypothetical protein
MREKGSHSHSPIIKRTQTAHVLLNHVPPSTPSLSPTLSPTLSPSSPLASPKNASLTPSFSWNNNISFAPSLAPVADVIDESFLTDLKSNYLSFQSKYLVKDYEEMMKERQANYLERMNYLENKMKGPNKEEEITIEEKRKRFQEFIRNSEDISIIWDQVSRFQTSLSHSSDPDESSQNFQRKILRSGVSFSDSFSKRGRRNSYLGDDVSSHPTRNNSPRISSMKPLRNSRTSPAHSVTASQKVNKFILPPTANPGLGKNFFHILPFSDREIIRQAQHPNNVLLGGRTILNKYLTEIFNSIKSTDWLMPYVVCILLLFAAEDSQAIRHQRSGSCKDKDLTQEESKEIPLDTMPSAIKTKPQLKSLLSLSFHVPSTPIFPLATVFPCYQDLSEVFVTSPNNGRMNFWTKYRLILIDGFLFQCELDQNYLIPVGYHFLDFDSVKFLDRKITVRGRILTVNLNYMCRNNFSPKDIC